MVTEEGLYWAHEIAETIFGRSTGWFYRHRKALHEEGFPHPISRVGRPRWSGKALIAWQRRDTPGPVAEAPPAKAKEPDYTSILLMRLKQKRDARAEKRIPA